MKVLQLFNNREISIIIWLGIGLAFFLMKSEVRKSVIDLIKSFFQKTIILSYLIAVAYTFIGVFLLYKFGFWTTSQIKDTLIWSFITVMSTLFSMNEVRDNKKYFKEAALENVKWTIVIEFITGLYTFSLITELILVPVALVLGATKAYAERDEKYAAVKKILDWFLFLMGLVILIHTIHQIRIHIKEFASYDTLRDFVLSPLLALWFLPYIYVMSLYMTYEEYFITMQMRIEDKKLLKFAKHQALLKFNFDTKSFKRWKDRIYIGNFGSKADVINSIKEMRRLQAIEKNPPPVDPMLGWSPYKAKDFLVNKSIKTDFYNKYEDNWMASSRYFKLNDTYSANTISYYIEGNEKVVKKLDLFLNVNKYETEQNAIQIFLECATLLHQRATDTELPTKIKDAILTGRHIIIKKNNIELSVSKDIWSNDYKYTINFLITHK